MSDQLLRQLADRARFLCGLRADGAVRPRQRSGGRPDEASRGMTPTLPNRAGFFAVRFLILFDCYSIIFNHHL